MSFQGLTPEAHHNNSSPTTTTCRGIRQDGKSCQRKLKDVAASGLNGSLTSNPLDSDDASLFFCWQHKDQSDALADRIRRTQCSDQGTPTPIKQQRSIDTLIERLGLVDLNDDHDVVSNHGKLDIQAPSTAHLNATATRRRRTHDQAKRARSSRPSLWSCCFSSSDHYRNDGPPARRRPVQQPQSRPSMTQVHPQSDHPPPPITSRHHVTSPRRPSQPSSSHHLKSSIANSPQPPIPRRTQGQASSTPTRTMPPTSFPTTPLSPFIPLQRTQSQTQMLLSLIPPYLSPQTTASLLAELSKPISSHDEPGYIYIYWLTPETQDHPDDDTATSILDDDFLFDTTTQRSPSHIPTSRTRQSNIQAQTTQALQHFSSATQRDHPKILLKIGRATNIHRRLSQWIKQCNQNITLVRYYPYKNDISAHSASPAGDKVPHVHKVERLVHLELSGMKADKGVCEVCGRGHKEWFEVEATREGLRYVDSVVRRWVGWAEQQSESRSRHGL